MDARDINTGRSDRLSQYVKSVRRGLNLSLRSVEEASGNQVSNAYLSQLESGKIRKPSPHILYALSTALGVSYEDLMERAGYIAPASGRAEGTKHGKAATFSIENLTSEEEAALQDHLAYIRWRHNR